MNLQHPPGEAFRALMELPDHPFSATARAVAALGEDGVQTAVIQIGTLLLRADTFNENWVNVAFWQHNGERLQAISRYWPEDGEVFRTEVSLLEEYYGGLACALARRILEDLSSEQRQEAADGQISPLSGDGEGHAAVLIHGDYEIVCIPAAMVLLEEGQS